MAYWSRYPGKYAHWRFSEGFVRGWEDAWMFLISEQPKSGKQVNELGMKTAWARMTTKDRGETYWEYGKYLFVLSCLTPQKTKIQLSTVLGLLLHCIHVPFDETDCLPLEHGFLQGVDTAQQDFQNLCC
jgi:hypothetical protein